MPRSFWQKYSCCFASAKATTAIMGGSTFLIRDVALNVGPLVRSRTAFALHRGGVPPDDVIRSKKRKQFTRRFCRRCWVLPCHQLTVCHDKRSPVITLLIVTIIGF